MGLKKAAEVLQRKKKKACSVCFVVISPKLGRNGGEGGIFCLPLSSAFGCKHRISFFWDIFKLCISVERECVCVLLHLVCVGSERGEEWGLFDHDLCAFARLFRTLFF
jgi:hypothetical protein